MDVVTRRSLLERALRETDRVVEYVNQAGGCVSSAGNGLSRARECSAVPEVATAATRSSTASTALVMLAQRVEALREEIGFALRDLARGRG